MKEASRLFFRDGLANNLRAVRSRFARRWWLAIHDDSSGGGQFMFTNNQTPNPDTVSSRFLRNWQDQPPQCTSPTFMAIILALAIVYFVTGNLGLRLAYLHPSATPVWAPSGIALAAFLLLGQRVWPAIFIGAFLLNLTTAGSIATSIGIAIGNTSEGMLGAYLVERFAGGRSVLSRAQFILRFAILAGVVSSAVSPTLGVTSLALGGFLNWANYWPIWLTWWLGGTVGNLIVAPFLILSITERIPRWDRPKITEAIVLALYLALVAIGVFGGISHPNAESYPLEFLCIPFLIWAALRLGQLEASIAVLILAVISIVGTLNGYGPFVRQTPNESLLLLQAFVGVIAVMTHAVAAVFAERKQAEQALQAAHDEMEERALSDPLTGLANYRRFVDVFDSEAHRSQRTSRSFALVLFDVDGLKKINDAYGHLTGTRALCRVGNTMRIYCRSIDTAVRYGGDEFALLLPETEAQGAYHVAERIAAQIARDGEHPAISVSFGIGVYPDDGTTVEGVFAKADRALYRMKALVGRKQHTVNRIT